MIGKAALLEAIAGTNRGLMANEAQKLGIAATIAQLEDRKPHSAPPGGDGISGG